MQALTITFAAIWRLTTLWIELKAPATKTTKAGKPTPLQVEWLERMSQVGYAARLCFGWIAAKETIQEYLA